MYGDYPSFEITFSHVEPFGYSNAPNEGTVKFSAKFGTISPSPQK